MDKPAKVKSRRKAMGKQAGDTGVGSRPQTQAPFGPRAGEVTKIVRNTQTKDQPNQKLVLGRDIKLTNPCHKAQDWRRRNKPSLFTDAAPTYTQKVQKNLKINY